MATAGHAPAAGTKSAAANGGALQLDLHQSLYNEIIRGVLPTALAVADSVVLPPLAGSIPVPRLGNLTYNISGIRFTRLDVQVASMDALPYRKVSCYTFISSQYDVQSWPAYSIFYHL